MMKTLSKRKFKSPTLNFRKRYINTGNSCMLEDWMIEELEETINRINNGEEELIPFEEWQEEMRREYNVHF